MLNRPLFNNKNKKMNPLRPLLLAASILMGIISCSTEHSEEEHGNYNNIKITGSTTVGPIVQKAVESFENKNEAFQISISEGGSGVGIANLIDGSTDIAMSSREMKNSEKIKFELTSTSFEEAIIAFDVLAVVVHPSNPISQLTKEQIKAVFAGNIKNWKELNGVDMEIVPVTRESSSGTFEFFKETALDDEEFTPSSLAQGSNGGIEQTVSQTKGAISYVGLAFLSRRIKPIKIAFEGNDFIRPNLENSRKKVYPLARPLYFYYLTSNKPKVKPLIDYILGPEGQKIAEEAGFVPNN